MDAPKNFQDVIGRPQNYNPKHGITGCPCPGHNTPEKTLFIKDAGDKALLH
jgi:transposase